MLFPEVKALTFDVFGTVVDWRTSIIREGKQLTRKKGIDVDWRAFADAWRGTSRRWTGFGAVSCPGRRSTPCIV